MNLHPHEVAKFDKMAHSWWDPEGDCKLLHLLNPLRLQFIQARSVLKGAQVLDLGCGGGILAETMAAQGAAVLGLDASAKAIEVATLHALETHTNIRYQVGTAEQYAQQAPTPFDIITCMELIEHVPDPHSLLVSCAQLLKEGGDLFISTLNRTPQAFLQAIVGAEYVLQLLPKGTHHYIDFIRPAELATWARNVGFSLKKVIGLEYKLLQQSFSLSSHIAVNYIAHFVKTASSEYAS